MKLGNILLVFYVVTTTAVLLGLIDIVSQKVNSANGIHIPLIIERTTVRPRWQRTGRASGSVLDPHLGFAHGETEALVKKLQEKYSWMDGFAVYSRKAPADLERPIILVMGGSTTDGVAFDHSWPEELSKLLAERGISGTVVNGGTTGYSSNQELLKLVRDGLEFKPDIIISYSGVNDNGRWGELPYSMVHPYQRHTLEFLTRPASSPLFPNTIYLLSKILFGTARMTATLGLPTSRTLGKQYERNMVLMEAIARASGATFYGIIQPNAYVGPRGEFRDHAYVGPRGEFRDRATLRDLYAQISDVPTRLPFMHDFTSIFDGEDGTYIADGVHATLKGDHIIAARVLDLIYPDLSAVGHNTTKRQSLEFSCLTTRPPPN